MFGFLIPILILSILIFFHELGHFLSAKLIGVKVEEFGIGLPPKVFGKKIKGTVYSINLLPFGGFVRLLGEDFDDPASRKSKQNSFASKKPIQRVFMLISGVLMNAILAVFIYYVVFFITGFKTMTLPLFFDHKFSFAEQNITRTVVIDYSKNSAAAEAGFNVGEAVIEIDNVPVYSAPDVRNALSDKEGKEVSVLLMDMRSIDRDLRSVRVVPRRSDDGSVLLGVILSDGFVLDYSNYKWLSGPMHSYNMTKYSVGTLYNLISMSVEAGDISPVSQNVSGPVGIFSVVRNILEYSGRTAVVGLLDLVALLSISLGVINILPFPALDGGRLVFVVFEMLGKKLSPKIEGMVHKFGMMALLVLLVLVTIKDIRNFL